MQKRKRIPNMQRRRKTPLDALQKTTSEPLASQPDAPEIADRVARAQAAFASNGSQTRYFVHGPMGLHSQQEPDGTWLFPVQDGLGSIRGVTDEALSILESRGCDPFGNLIDTQGTTQTPFGFTGEVTDNSGLVHLRTRYYDPRLGVFPNPDPLPGNLQEAMSLNPYMYVHGNPVNLVDPSGMVAELPGAWDHCAPRRDPLPPICPGNPVNLIPNANNQCCYRYRPEKAVNYAKLYANSINPDYFELADFGGDCANFVSQALRDGKLPMNVPGGLTEFATSGIAGWACTDEGYQACAGNRIWNEAPILSSYLKALQGSGSITLAGASLSDNPQLVRNMIEQHLPELSDVQVGDVLYISDSNPHHVAIVAGWGPAILRPEDMIDDPQLASTTVSGLLGEYLVPYVIDHGGQHRNWARPYYTLRWGLGPESFYYSGNSWEFIQLPGQVCVDVEDYIP